MRLKGLQTSPETALDCFAPFATASLTLGLPGCSRVLGMRASSVLPQVRR